ncbi:MAG: 16S rRNA (cytosine(1402)-N(4))-methyltransferase, partial [Candidatus Omnitrophica bacterium]|nr:16S rRNA (cytosine(1402)-N(4))-methyltransferase [Candidatus Omnitrophota bacterium]
IFVNDELKALEEGLKRVVPLLRKDGRIAVISFHSLEDRIVKNLFKEYQKQGILSIITKKPLRPSEAEVASNPRARSAKMRVAQKG